MITDIKDINKIKVGYYIISVDYSHITEFKIRKISDIRKIGNTIIFDTVESDSFDDLFAYENIKDYVCKNPKEVLNNFAEYMI
jgi:hypothetical protein